jgi:DNA-binding transcriptional ArsR family regulator
MFDVCRSSNNATLAVVADARHPDVSEIELTRVLAALSDPTRIGLVRVLADGEERAWNELRVPLAKSTLSHHLKVLRDAGVSRTRREGTRCFVRLRVADLDERFPGLLDVLLAAAAAHGVDGQVSIETVPGDVGASR